MATTTRLNPSFRFPATRSVNSDLRATTARISYPRTLTAPRGYLVVRANKARASSVVTAAEKGFEEETSISYTREIKQRKEKRKLNLRRKVKWDPNVEGYLRFLVDSKLVYDTLEGIIEDSNFITCECGFQEDGIGKSRETRDGFGVVLRNEIPEPMEPGKTYSEYLKVLAENDPQAFICHFYNIYFAHSAGGQMVGTKVSEKILDGKELEFYKWDGQLSQLLKNVKEKLNKVAECWTREEKNHCLEKTEKSFKFSGEILPSHIVLILIHKTLWFSQ